MSRSSSGRPSPKKRDYHHGDLRRTLLDTAVALVAEHDICALTLREVARRAGVTHAAPYHHFPSKAALVAAVAEEGYDALYAEQVEAAKQAGTDPVERLRALGLAYVKFALAHPGHFRVMFRMDVSDWTETPKLAEASQRNMVLLSSTIHEVIETQHLEMDLMELTLAAWTVAHGLATLWVDGPLRRSNLFPHDGMLTLAARVIGTSTARLYAEIVEAPARRPP